MKNSSDKKTLENFEFILVHPKTPENIGLVCRVLKNFGFSNLKIIGSIDKKRAQITSRKGIEILKKAQFFESLEEALKDANLVVGTSRRKRDLIFTFELKEVLRLLFYQARRGRVCVIFGREDTGLREDEIELCDFAIKINAHPSFDSLNLSHSVAIMCYELYNFYRTAYTIPKLNLAKRNEIEDLYKILETLFPKLELKPQTVRIFKRIFKRSGLTKTEVNVLKLCFLRMLEKI